MNDPKVVGSVKVWILKSSTGEVLGQAYSLEQSEVKMKYGQETSEVEGYTMVLTGTYTSTDGRIAGKAFDNYCKEVGNTEDKLFKPNAWLVFRDGTVSFSKTSSFCMSIPVYKLVDDSVLTNVVNARKEDPDVWRFFVEKSWTKQYFSGDTWSGKDLIIVDFDASMTLSEACAHVQGLGRKGAIYHDPARNEDFSFSSKVTAALLDTGPFRPFLLQGKPVNGVFPQKQSNVIVIK